ncbi:hypothetical protein, partial [Laspinema olomoucense]|uniref:hypothetical protein n=1 Tax=Laspinema olomoucense TaxID=3231600 RepID=UPI0021BAA975
MTCGWVVGIAGCVLTGFSNVTNEVSMGLEMTFLKKSSKIFSSETDFTHKVLQGASQLRTKQKYLRKSPRSGKRSVSE